MEPIDLRAVATMIAPLVYLLPTFVFWIRTRRFLAVPLFGLCNLLLGWTVIGWFYLLYRALGGGEPLAPPGAGAPSAGVSPPRIPPRIEEDPESSPDLAAALEARGSIGLLHEATGVRVRVTLTSHEGGRDSGYRLEVPTAFLDPRRGHRHRARRALEDLAWRRYEREAGPTSTPESLDDEAETWSSEVESGGARAAVTEARHLLTTIVDFPPGTAFELCP